MNNTIKIEGIVTIRVVTEDGQVVREIEQKNNITDSFANAHGIHIDNYNDIFGLDTPKLNDGNTHLAIANIGKDYGRQINYLYNILAVGAPSVAFGNKLTIVTATKLNLLGYIEVRERINFTDLIYGIGQGYSRNFNAIGLVTGATSSGDSTQTGSSTYTYPNSTVYYNCLAYTFLNPVCTQGSNEFLDIVYRIQVSGLDYLVINDYITELSGTITNPIQNKHSLVNVSNVSGYTRLGRPYDNNYNEELLTINNMSGITLSEIKQLSIRGTVANNVRRGRVIRSLLIGSISSDDNYNVTGGNVNFSSTTFQPLYSHNGNATTPYYDVNTLTSGSIKPTLSGSWNKDLPEVYLLKVITGGAMTTSTYKYSVRKFIGTSDTNSWTDYTSFTPFLHKRNTTELDLYPNYHVRTISTGNESNCQRLRYSDNQIVQGDSTGVQLVNIFNGTYQVYDSVTFPAFTANAITQYSIQGSLIYVACRNTGLWKINVVANTVTNLSTVSCLGVDSNPNRTIAIFNDGSVLKLKTSDDNFTSYLSNFTFNNSSLLGSSFNNLLYLKIDQNISASSIRIAIACITTATVFGIYWWDGSTLTSGPTIDYAPYVSGNLNSSAANPTNLVCNSNGTWIFTLSQRSTYFFQFANSSYSNTIGSSIGTTPLILEDGNLLLDGVVFLCPTSGFTITQLQSFATTGINYGGQPSIVYMGKGLILYDNMLKVVVPNCINSTGTGVDISNSGAILNPYLWNTYSWNGTTWILDNATWNGTTWVAGTGNGKPSHTTTDALNGDVSASFTELGSAGLTAGHYYTQILCNGISLDNTLNPFSFSYYWGFYPISNVSIGNSYTIPSTSPYVELVPTSNFANTTNTDTGFCSLFGDDLSKHSLSIAGYSSPATLIIDQTIAPQANEILLNQSNGSLIFNPTDAGKTVTGNYTYVTGHKRIVDYTVAPFAGVYKPIVLLRSDAGVTLTGSNVTSWQDQSGYGNTATKGVTDYPTVVTGGLNSLNTVKFNSNISFMNLPNVGSWREGWTMIALVKFTNVSNTNVFFSSDYISNSIPGEFSFQVSPTGTLVFNLRGIDVNYNANVNRSFSSNSNIISSNTWNIISITSKKESNYIDTNSIIVRVNHTNQPLTVSTYPNYNTPITPVKYPSDKCILGGSIATPSNSFIGEMAWFSFYKNYLTIYELSLVEAGITSIFGI